MGIVLLVLAGTPVIAALVRIERGSRPERSLAWFCFQYDVVRSPQTDERVLQYLRRTRRWRIAGAIIGVLLPYGSWMFWEMRLDLYTGLFIGWFLAGVIAEARSDARQGADAVGRERRTASLAPRRLREFLPPFASRVLLVSGAALLLAGTTAIAPRAADGIRHAQQGLVSAESIGAASAVAICLTAIAALSLQRLVRKPYPVDDPELDVAEYAIRTAAVVRVAAGWAALLFVIAVRLGFAAAFSMRHPWSWGAHALWLASVIGVLVAWAGVPTRVVRRTRVRLGAPA